MTLTGFIVVINQHHGIPNPSHFVVSDDGKSHANLSLIELQIIKQINKVLLESHLKF